MLFFRSHFFVQVPHKDINIKEFPGSLRGAKSDKTSTKKEGEIILRYTLLKLKAHYVKLSAS